MDYKAIIREAWEIAQNKSLVWLGSISSFLATLVGTVYLAYQITAFKNSEIFGGHIDYAQTFSEFLDFLQDYTQLSFILGGTAIVIFVAYLIIPLIINGALIDLVVKYKDNRPLKGGVAKGIINLFPMTEFHALMSPFSLFSILMEVSLILRLSGIEIMYIALPVFIIFYLIGFVLVVIFSFTDQEIILQNTNMSAAMGASTKLVLVNFKETIFLMLIMFIISIRIIINAILILLVPLIIISLTGYLASVALAQLGLYIGIGIGVILLFLTSYFMGTLTVFSTAVWTLSYLQMKGEMESEKTL